MSDGLRRNTMLGSPSSNNSGGGGGTSTSGSYTVNLNGQWELATTPANPDPALYDGVYRSASNYNINNGVAIMYITIKDCSSFQIYIRSYAEAIFDYVMISQLDQTISGSTSYSDTTLVKAHTRGNQQSGTALSNYTLVEYIGITSGEHTITVVYRKDSGSHSGDDRGYVLIPKLQSGGDSEGGGGSDEGPIDINNYLTIEALEDGLTAKLSTNACEYCIDGDGVWNTLEANTTTPSINQGQVISFRGNLTPADSKGIGTFTISKKCNLQGNCMSMLFCNNAENILSLAGKNYAFYKLFENCINIIEVSLNFLPATTLSKYCYYRLFYGCTSLTNAPELPSTSLPQSCYGSMFYACEHLIQAPELPNFNVVSSGSCTYMFHRCSTLTQTPNMIITTSQTDTYTLMFSSCTNLTYAGNIIIKYASTQSFDSMFYNCYSLKIPPTITTTQRGLNCFARMFMNCNSLEYAPKLTPYIGEQSYLSMFQNCTSLKAAPELSTVTLNRSLCYADMFKGCKNINFIKALFTTTPDSTYTRDWVSNVSSTGIFVKNAEATWNVTGVYGIPEGWTVIEEESTGNLVFWVEGHQYAFSVDLENVTTWEEFISGTGSVEFSILEDGSIYSNVMHNKVVYEGTLIFVNKYHTLINGYTYAIYQDTNPA